MLLRMRRRESRDLRRDLLQNLHETLAVAQADDGVEIALMPARATRQLGQRLLAGGSQVQAIDATVAAHAVALDQAAPHQILDHRREARLVAPVGVAERGLADTRVA